MQEKLGAKREYPPMPYLEQVMNHVPKAAQTYVWLWKHSNHENICQLRSSRIAEVTMMSKATFKNSLRALCREGLANFEESDDVMKIELTGWDDDEELDD